MNALERIQPPFGRLSWDHTLNWWVGGALSLPLFDGRSAKVQIPSETPDHPHAGFAPELLDAARDLLALPPSARDAVTQHVQANYAHVKAEVGDEFPEVERDGVWRHVAPRSVFFDRRDNDGLIYVSFECECAWEIEHGLQLVLQRGVRWVRVSQFSGHFTDGEAYAAPSLDAWMDDPSATLPLRSFEQILAIADKDRRRR